jgi:hypothetical protein
LSAQPLHELVDRYVKAWNDPDPLHRRAELASLYTDDGYIATQIGVHAGIDAVVGHVSEVYDQFIALGRYRFSSGGVLAHHDYVLFRWEMREAASGELADAGMNFFHLAADGRIIGDHQFTLGVDSSIGSAASIRP